MSSLPHEPHKINRREFLGVAAAGAVAGVMGTKMGSRALAAAEPATQPAKRPNILLIITDEHNHNILGNAGNNIIRTANMDALAKRGVTFDNCYCNSPLCVPSRHSITSCKYISRVGVWNNDCWLPSNDTPSIARVMTAAGYDSILCGKMHYDRTRRYGFNEIWGTANDSYVTGHGSRRPADKLKEAPGYGARFNDFKAGSDSSVLTHDRQVTTHSVGFLKNRKADDKPFFMIAGYLAPHFPLIVPQEYYDIYKNRVPMPVNPAGSEAAQPLNYQHLRVGFHMGHVPADIIKHGRELYYGLTQWVDEQIGQVLGALAETGLADDTIVIYTSDHGENMGEHVLWWKNCMYEHSSHVPLIVSYPRRWAGGQRRSGVCSLVDMVRTVADLGGATTPGDWNGHSLAPLLNDPAAKWKDMAVSEYYAHNIASGYAMIRSGDHKYVYHTAPDADHPPQQELYDLINDPGEFTNLALADEAKHHDRISAMREALVAEIGEPPDVTEQRCRADYAKGYGRTDKRPKKKKKSRMTTPASEAR